MLLHLIFLTLLSTKLTSAIPCAGFSLGTLPYGNDIISDGVARMDSHWDSNHELSRHGVESLTLYETFPSDLGPNNYTYSVNVLEPNEANCDPQVSRTCDISTTHCNVTVTFRCASAGQTRIRLSFQDFKRGEVDNDEGGEVGDDIRERLADLKYSS